MNLETEEKNLITNIIVGIAKTLFQTFGSKYRVYVENVEQGFTEPCFSIQHLLAMNEPKIPVQYLRRYSFNVHYFPKDKLHANDEMHEVARQLFLILEYIFVFYKDGENELDYSIKASKMSYEIQEGHLHFFVDYNLFVKKQQDEGELMETLIHKKSGGITHV